jgi:MYXO-CTERM domain-containing protein
MWFGQGPKRDFSYDGDVVYHEFGHAVVDATLQLGGWTLDKWGSIDAPGGMNEGLADYFSAALSGDGKVGEYASQDFDATRSSIRDLANKDTCLGTVVGEVHQDSTFFSGGLWAVRQGLAAGDRTKFDAAIYKAMRTNPGKPELNYGEAVQLFLATLKTDLPAAATSLEDEMTKGRGILPECSRVHEWAGKPLDPPASWPGGFTAPGKGSLGITANRGDLAPGILQLHVPLASPALQVVVTFQSVQQQQASGGLFGPQGTPFAPVVLARFGGPIEWTTSGKITATSDVRVDAVGDKAKPIQTYTATLDVPQGTTELSLQIANAGDQDGSYQGVSLQIVPQEQPQNPTNPPVTPQSSGCSCSTPPTSGPGPWAGVLGGLALAGLGLRRRRR